MIVKIKIKLAAVTLLALLLIGTLGTGMAAAGSGHSYPGGGEWWWENIPGIFALSEYWHGSQMHSATAKVGLRSSRDEDPPNVLSRANIWGIGTTYVYWNAW